MDFTGKVVVVTGAASGIVSAERRKLKRKVVSSIPGKTRNSLRRIGILVISRMVF